MRLASNHILSLTILAQLLPGIGKAQQPSAPTELGDKDFIWYCEAKEATEDQRYTVRMLFQLAEMDYDPANCREAFDTLARFSYIALPNSDIKDLAPLSGLDGVDFINAPGNSIKSLDGLINVPELRKLWLPDNELSEFPDISRFPSLNNLVLHNNPITTLAKLSAHPALRTLRMNATHIKDYSPLAKLNVSWLELGHTRYPEALSTLPQLPTVIVANLSGNGLTDFSRFKAFPKVETIVANKNSISDLKDLASFDPLPTNLQLTHNKLAKLDSKKDSKKVFANLGSIDFSHNPMTDFGFLAELKDEILSLKLDGTAFADWSLISRFMPHLYQLSLNGTPLAEIPAPKGSQEWSNVFRMELVDTKVRSFAAFKSIKAPKLRRFEGPVLDGATEESCPTADVPDAISRYCEIQIEGQ